MKKIFVAIASYRDTECEPTVSDLFRMADFQERIFLGICLQLDRKTDYMPNFVDEQYAENIRIAEYDCLAASGAGWAKSIALGLADKEEYVLLIDSHMRFAKGWDSELINILEDLKGCRAYLSTYPSGYEPPDNRETFTTVLYPKAFEKKILRFAARPGKFSEPVPSFLAAGGFLFGRAEMFRAVPYDPHIYFYGEEIAYSARLFTQGWNGYAPHKCLIHHFYTRNGHPKHWTDNPARWTELNERSRKRVLHLLSVQISVDEVVLENISEFGLGIERTLGEFQRTIGVNFYSEIVELPVNGNSFESISYRLNPVYCYFETSALALRMCKHGYMHVPKNDTFIGKSHIYFGEWHEPLVQRLIDHLSVGDSVIEIGSGFGSMTIPLSKMVGSSGRVYAFEQSKIHFQLLNANIAVNDLTNIYATNACVTIRHGLSYIEEPEFKVPGNYGIVKQKQAARSIDFACSKIRIEDMSFNTRIDVILVDAPGQAADILGCRQHLEKYPCAKYFVSVDNAADRQFVKSLAQELGRDISFFQFPLFNVKNYSGEVKNIFSSYIARYAIF